MEKLDRDNEGSSLNIVQDNIDTLKTLFPDIFSEGKIDFDVLREILGEAVETAEERYNFSWHGKSAARRIAQTPSTGTLRPCKAESKDWETTQNLFIEGDNLEVLKLLQKSYHKQVKMIYIDPPYNTGKEFIYPDNYKDNLDTYLEYTGQKDSEGRKFGTNAETSGRYHTNWLNMMYPRLKLARNLLRDDGVIFISIDDNEVSNLRKLCDEIFGEENSLIPYIWALPRGINAGHISRSHEYILAYAKKKESLALFKKIGESEYSIDRCNKKIDRRHPASAIKFPKGIPYVGKDQVLTGQISGSEKVEIEGELVFKDGKLDKVVTLIAGWTMKDMIEKWLNGEEVYDTKGQKIVEFFFKENGKLYSKKVAEWQSSKSILNDVPDTQIARTEIEDLFGDQDIFPYPKPSGLIGRLIKLTTNNNDLILDFFSGSCPTAHALFLNDLLDSMHRKFIMVQLPERIDPKDEDQKAAFEFCKSINKPTTISEIGKERIRRAGDKIKADNADKEGIENLDIGFKVFKLSSSNIKPWDADFDNLENALFSSVDNIKGDRSEDDVLYEILLKYGLDLAVPIEERQIGGKTVYSIGFGALVICLADAITLDVVEGIGGLKAELEPEVMRVVFKDSGFADDVVKTNAIQILKKHGIDDVKSL